MLQKNRSYAKRIKERLVAHDSKMYSDLSVSQIKTIIDYFSRNIVYSLYKHWVVDIKYFFHLYPNAKHILIGRKKRNNQRDLYSDSAAR